MANANLTMGVTGIDKTGAAFNSVKMRAKATGASIRAALGGALAAAGAYLSFRSIKSGIEELGRLDDIAAKTSTDVNEITKAVNGLQILGIATDINSFAKALQLMEKNTGRSGLGGFYETISAIGKIPDVAERGKAAIQAFGRSGLEFMPVINAASNGTAALEGVINAMRGVSSAAARAGDDVADGMKIASETFRSLWLDAIGGIAEKLTGHLPTSFRQSMAVIMAYVDYYARSIGDIWDGMVRRISGFFDVFRARGGALGAGISATWEKLFGSGGSWGDVWKTVQDAWNAPFEETERDLEELDNRTMARAEKLAQALEAANKLQSNYDNAAKGGRGTSAAPLAAQTAGEIIGTAAAKAAQRVTNQLMLSGSSAANRLSVLGPEYQNETKKQTDLLRKIAQNTEKTAENTDDMGEAYTATDL